MSLFKLPRLAHRWQDQTSLFEKYWDQICSRVESLHRGIFSAGELPSSPSQGDRAFALDATSTTFNALYVSGGSNPVPIFYDGTNWRIG